MTVCIALSDTARGIAEFKIAHTPIDEVKTYYASRPQPRLTVPLVDKVYGEEVGELWDYVRSFFKECASELVRIPANRVDFAARCMQNSMAAGIAAQLRAEGVAKQRAYMAEPTIFGGPMPNDVVDRAYTHTGTRAEEMLAEWNLCMEAQSQP